MEDKFAIINKDKLNSSHMEAVNKLLRQKFGNSINGLQLTEKVSIFHEKQNRWIIDNLMKPVTAPACQIHYNHNDHWVCSIYHENGIFLLDSLGTDRENDKIISNGLQIQLSQLFGRKKDKINIKVPQVMKQNNSIDCGLYAIAYITSYCFRNSFCFDLIFDSKTLRQHFLKCFEN